MVKNPSLFVSIFFFLVSPAFAGSFATDLSLNDTEKDRAGVWNVFGPGHGKLNDDPNDWSWTLELDLPEEKPLN